MQHERAKFQNKLSQLSSTVVQLGQHYYGEKKIGPRIRYLLISEKLNMIIQWSTVGDSVTCISKAY